MSDRTSQLSNATVNYIAIDCDMECKIVQVDKIILMQQEIRNLNFCVFLCFFCVFLGFFYHKIVMKWLWLSPNKPSVYSCQSLCIKWKFPISYSILQYQVFRDPNEGKVITDSVSNSFIIAFIIF